MNLEIIVWNASRPVQGHDYKWNITKEGNYRVTLNMYTMTIDFKLLQSIPDDLPCKEIWDVR